MTLDDVLAGGFDRSQENDDDTISVRCSQCAAVCINGVPCHENRCPNTPKPSHDDDDYCIDADIDEDSYDRCWPDDNLNMESGT